MKLLIFLWDKLFTKRKTYSNETVSLTKNIQMLHSTVLVVQCNGCMATNHEFVALGIIDGFEYIGHQKDIECAVVKVLKKHNQDHRDIDLGVLHIPIINLQKLANTVYVQFK